MICTGPAYGQDSASDLEEVLVTGSRIRRQDFTANSPITTLDRNTFETTSTIGIETVLNQLPQFVPAVTQFTTTDVQNTATNTVGASTVSLRGLGPNRNLVLIDGRRGQPVNASLVIDTNSIPSAAIQRVEVISGGASAVYGADAVGGVVNFILRDDFEGATLDTRYGLTQEGDNGELTLSGLFGSSFDDGRGNVMFGLEHSRREKVLRVDRDWRVDDLNNPALGFPGADFWVADTFVSTPGNPPSGAAIAEVFPNATGTVSPFTSWYINRSPDGTGTVYSGAGFFGGSGAGGSYKYDGPLEHPDYPGVAWRKFQPNGVIMQNQLNMWSSIPLDRYSAFGRGRYDLGGGVRASIQGLFSKNRNETLLGYSGAGLNANNVTIPYGSEVYGPSLAADGVTTLPAYLSGGAYGLNCAPTGGCTESEAFPLPPEMRTLLDSRPNPNGDIGINRSLDFMGSRRSKSNTTTFQLVFGLDGEAFGDSVWDVSVSHGQTETVVNFYGFTARERWRAVASHPNFGQGFSILPNNGWAAGLATCTTGLPLVRHFEPSADCIAALQANLQNNSQLEQNVAEANLTGTATEIWAGPLQYAVGASYRDEEYAFQTDTLTTNESFTEGGLGLFPANNTYGKFDVSEIYGELLIPLIEGRKGVEHFNLELGGRYSDYSSVGAVGTYKALIDWAVTPWARFRGGYNLANRAPNLGELFLSRTQIFGGDNGEYGDQCSQNSAAGPYSTNAAVNVNGEAGAQHALEICRAMMTPTAAAEYYDNRAVEDQPDGVGGAGTGLINTVGNPNVDSEEAETWTLGVVIDSPFEGNILSGFTVSVDYYQIEITDMIATENPDPLFQRCLDPAFNPGKDPSLPACLAFTRDPLTGSIGTTDTTYTNEGRAYTTGVDLQVDWRTQLAGGAGLSVNMLANLNMENITQSQPTVEEIDWAGTRGCALQLQCMGYDYRVFTTVNYFRGPWSATVRWQHWPSIKSGNYATDPTTVIPGVPSSYDLFALSGSYNLNDSVTFRVGIENLLDKDPPLGGGNPASAAFPVPMSHQAGATYDPLGRRGFVSVTMNF